MKKCAFNHKIYPVQPLSKRLVVFNYKRLPRRIFLFIFFFHRIGQKRSKEHQVRPLKHRIIDQNAIVANAEQKLASNVQLIVF